ncbi:MAG: RNA polymerase sigma factor [Phycisphaerae bacterium]
MQADNIGNALVTGWDRQPVATPEQNQKPAAAAEPADTFLLESMLGGDSTALRKLIDRYDRLVRFTIYKIGASRCASDPQWLDAVASDVWSGFVQSLQRNPDSLPENTKAYLTRIARNRAISAVRGKNLPINSLDDHEGLADQIEGESADPADELADLEMLAALRKCLGDLDGDARQLADHLESITQRRWKAAAEAVGCAESTLRSRWKNVLGHLRDCVSAKTGIFLAPDRADSDNS